MNDIYINDLTKQLTLSYVEKEKFVSTSSQLIKILFKNELTSQELKELDRFPKIYYLGSAQKKNVSEETRQIKNREYIPNDHIAFRYEIIKIMGKGSFGTVIKAFDHKENEFVALKMVKNSNNFVIENEVKILKFLESKNIHNTSNVVHLMDTFTYKESTGLVFELMWIDLYELLRRNKFKGCGLRLVQKFCFSLLICLNALSSYHIIHGDLKPENIMLKKPGYNKIKVIDFSCSCFENERLFTYFQSRYYRAPEVILGAPYDSAIDMWSLGCILAEMHSGYPLLPGENSFDQMALIMELKGMPPKELLDTSVYARDYITSDGYPRYCNISTSLDGSVTLTGGTSPRCPYRQPPGTRDLSAALDDGSNPEPEFIDFINRCLEYNPKIRMKPAEALQHIWLKRRHTA